MLDLMVGVEGPQQISDSSQEMDRAGKEIWIRHEGKDWRH